MKKQLSRREAFQWMAVSTASLLAACQRVNLSTPTQVSAATPLSTETVPPTLPPTATAAPEATATLKPAATGTVSTVYKTSALTPKALLAIYQALNVPAQGKVAVKISSGEPGGNYYLSPELIAPLVKEVNGTIVECNTAYGGGRSTTAGHLRVMEEHGFSAIAPVDILDAEGHLSLPIQGGHRLTETVVGSHFADYDFVVILAHFKGHDMAGFGGVIKNMSIGIAAAMGKSLIHSAGKETTGWGMNTPRDQFLESMAEAAKGVADHLGANIVYIDVMNNLSVDCDCLGHPAKPTMADIGLLASLDPVAVDQACVDRVYAAPDGQDLIARMESRQGVHMLEHAEAIGLGRRAYELVELD